MNRPAIILHRGVRPLPLAHMGRHDPNAAYLRDGVPLHIRQSDNLRRFNADRFEGPPRHETIGSVDLRMVLLAIGLLALIPWIALLATVVVK